MWSNVPLMTDTNTPNLPTNLPTSPEYQFAYVLATIHSTFIKGDMERVYSLLANLPTALKDPKVSEIYYSTEVDEYLDWAYPQLFGKTEDEEEADMDENEAQEFLDALYDILFGGPDTDEDLSDAFKAPELRDGGVCGNPDCECAQDDADDWEPMEQDDREELLAETEDFVIVKIWK